LYDVLREFIEIMVDVSVNGWIAEGASILYLGER